MKEKKDELTMEEERKEGLFYQFIDDSYYLKINRPLIDVLGIKKAIFFSYLIEKNRKIRKMKLQHKINCVKHLGEKAEKLIKKGYFYLNYEAVYDVIRIKKDAFRESLKFFEENDLMFIQKAGIPSRNFYKIRFDSLFKILENSEPKEICEDEYFENDENFEEYQQRTENRKQAYGKPETDVLETVNIYNINKENINRSEKSIKVHSKECTAHSVLSTSRAPLVDKNVCSNGNGSSGNILDNQTTPDSSNHCSGLNDLLDSNATQSDNDKFLKASSSKRDKFKNKKKIVDSLDAEVDSLLSFWTGLNLKTSKSAAKDKRVLKQVLNGTFFNDYLCSVLDISADAAASFTPDDIRHSMMNFAAVLKTRATNSMKQITPATFFYNDQNKKNPSSFICNLKSSSKVVLDEDPNPDVTDELKKAYYELICGKIYPETISTREEKKFREIAKFVVEFRQKNLHRLYEGLRSGYGGLCKTFVRAAIAHWNGDKARVNLGFLNGPTMKNESFSKYLCAEGKLTQSMNSPYVGVRVENVS